MMDPATAQMMITGLINTLTAYITYKVGMKQAEVKGASTSSSPVPDAVSTENSETALAVIEQNIAAKGKSEEQIALAGFKQNPEMFKQLLLQILTDLANRDETFEQQLQGLAHQLNLASGDKIQPTAVENFNAQASHGSVAIGRDNRGTVNVGGVRTKEGENESSD